MSDFTDKLKATIEYLIDQLKDPLSWRGLTFVLTAFGVTLKPEHYQAITAFGMLIVGMIGLWSRENQKQQKAAEQVAADVATQVVKDEHVAQTIQRGAVATVASDVATIVATDVATSVATDIATAIGKEVKEEETHEPT